MASPSAMAIARLRTEAVVKEMENKQNMMRLKWFEENYEKVYKDPALPKEKIPKKAAVLYEELRKMRKERFNADKKLRTKQLEECKIEEKEKSLEIMYPVPLEVKRVLYEGKSWIFRHLVGSVVKKSNSGTCCPGFESPQYAIAAYRFRGELGTCPDMRQIEMGSIK